jgi:hypothetical protein
MALQGYSYNTLIKEFFTRVSFIFHVLKNQVDLKTSWSHSFSETSRGQHVWCTFQQILPLLSQGLQLWHCLPEITHIHTTWSNVYSRSSLFEVIYNWFFILLITSNDSEYLSLTCQHPYHRSFIFLRKSKTHTVTLYIPFPVCYVNIN